MNVSYTMFNNYHNAAKEFSNGDMTVYGRLMFIINTYAIDGVTVEDLSPVEKLFLTSIKASIDKSIRLSEAGRKGGKHSTREETPEECSEMNTDTSLIDSNNEACKPSEKACNEIEIEIEEEVEEEGEERIRQEENKNENKILTDWNYIFSLLGFDFIPSSYEELVFKWVQERKIPVPNKKTAYCLIKIAEKLENNKRNIDYLDFVFDKALVPYSEESRKLGLIFSAMGWDSTASEYELTQRKKTKQNRIKPPKSCTVCGSGLVERLPGTVECPECRKKGNPIWWELNPIKNKWVCSL